MLIKGKRPENASQPVLLVFSGLNTHFLVFFTYTQARFEAQAALVRMLGHAQRATDDLATHVGSAGPCVGSAGTCVGSDVHLYVAHA